MASQEHVGWDIAADTHTHGFKKAFCIRPFQTCFSKSPCHPLTSTAALEPHAQLLCKKSPTVRYSHPASLSRSQHVSLLDYIRNGKSPPCLFLHKGTPFPKPYIFAISSRCTLHPTRPPYIPHNLQLPLGNPNPLPQSPIPRIHTKLRMWVVTGMMVVVGAMVVGGVGVGGGGGGW